MKTAKTPQEVTKKLDLIKSDRKLSDEKLCELIGISKPSLYDRKKNHNWKKSEAFMIMNL